MLKKQGWLFLAILVITSACAKKSTEHAPWPATVSFVGLSENETTKAKSALKGFSENFKSEIFFFDDRPTQFRITVGKIQDASQSSTKAGLATFDESFCEVELNEIVFEESYASYIEPVLWHELGHCAGMEHDPNTTELMYHVASPKESYSVAAISRFMKIFSGLTAISSK